MQDVNSGDHCGDSSDPFADATRAAADTATVPNAPQVATISSCRAIPLSPAQRDVRC